MTSSRTWQSWASGGNERTYLWRRTGDGRAPSGAEPASSALGENIMKRIVGSAILMIVSLAVALVLCEALLRLFLPRYQYAAEAPVQSDNDRIWSRLPNARISRSRPDTGTPHEIEYNNIGLRQPRDVTQKDLQGLTTIAFMGDSYTENTGLPTYAVFTELLNYLINIDGKRYEVLNFGVDGYGTDQSYLYYTASDFAAEARYVFYVFCANDITDIYVNRLFWLDDRNGLHRAKPPITTWLLRVLSKLYLTYFVLDAQASLVSALNSSWFKTEEANKSLYQKYKEDQADQRLQRLHSNYVDQIQRAFYYNDFDSISDLIALFRAILHAWRREVDRNGGEFTIVVLPLQQDEKIIKFIETDFDVVSLYRLFKRSIPYYEWANVRFRTDGHWDERGNMMAAVHLFRLLETRLKLDVMSCDELKDHLRAWYATHDATLPVADFECMN
jgi:hypothetical protein